ncbi:hypothetical protein QYF61_021640 [Mycteria americana]|uniref:Endonuclease/exonuclease/phosphatase domain-containing protein n=1 Tax=Mycteria americana TaxID=33587 RepID=A0AAN7NGY0_MYCAM|nr:hypothetical protein QYF61_021640 [Mycteria americana]
MMDKVTGNIFYDETTSSVDKGRGVDIIYPDFSEAFNTVNYKIIKGKLIEYRPDKWTMRWTENWLNCWVQRAVISSTKSSWRPVTSDVSQGSILGPILFNVFINDRGNGTVCPQQGCKLYKTRDLDKLEKCVNRNLMTFNKGKWKVLPLERITPCTSSLEISPGSLKISLGEACQCLREDVLARSSGLPSQWRQGMKIHVAAKTKGLCVDVLETTEEPENGHVGIRVSPPKKVTGSIAQLKCIYTNACSMGNKEEELEAIVHQENYDIVAIMETWWDDSHNWSAAMDGYKLFRRHRQGRRDSGVALYTTHQDEEADEIFYKQLGEVSQSLALVLVGDFNLPDAHWKYKTAERKQSRRFLECVEDNLLTQLVSEPMREGTPLDLLFVNREGLVGDVTVGGCLGQSDQEMIEILILGEVRRGVSRTAPLDFRRADFGLFRSLVDRVPWEAVLKGKGVQEGWTFFKKEI